MGHTGHSRHAGKAFRERGTGFLRLREGVFRHAGKAFLESRNGLFRVTVRDGALRKRIGMRFLYTVNTFELPAFEKNNVKIFYFP